MKHILIIITNFEHGGTNKSLENLLSLLDNKKYQVDVFVMEHYGPYSSLLNNCTIIPKNRWIHALIANLKNSSGIIRLMSIILKSLSKVLSLFNFDLADYFYQKEAKRLIKNKNYNSVVAFSEGAPTAFGVYFSKFNNIAWIRCDYSNYLTMNGYPNEKIIYRSFTSIVCVSSYTQKVFTEIYPEFAFKTHAIHNVLDVSSFIGRSKFKELDFRFKNDVFTILSIGRFYQLKRFSSIPDIAKKLVEMGCKFKWYIIGGEGDKWEKEEFVRKIHDYQLKDILIDLGEKNNPYFYITKSDLLVSTSLTEACPNVINEAKILHLPVVATNFGSAFEFIENNINGFIAPIDQISEQIAVMINNESEYNRIKNNLSNFKYDNKNLILKVENLLK